jgi:hypothetical protein
MRTAFFIRAAIIALWIASMGALLRYEAYPEWFTRTIPGYKGLISDTLLTRESWSRILIGDTPAGYSHTTLGVNDDTAENLLKIGNRLRLRFRLGSEEIRVLSHTDITLDRDLRLVSFASSVSAGPITLSAKGRQLPDGLFEITLNTGGAPSVRTIAIPPDTLLYSPGQELALRNLRPGTRLTLKTLNPLTLQATAIMIEAAARETITLNGETLPVTRLVSSWQGISLQSWVNDDGLVVRQETPLGWIIEACTPEAALASITTDQPPPALFGVKGTDTPFNLLFGKALRNL